MADIFFETFGQPTDLTSAASDWHLSTANQGCQIVKINDCDQDFHLEVFMQSKISLKTTEPMNFSRIISIGRLNKVMANMELVVKDDGLTIIVNKSGYIFCKSSFIHIELNGGEDMARLDVSLNKGKFMTMVFDKSKLITCCFDGSGLMKSCEIYCNMCQERSFVR